MKTPLANAYLRFLHIAKAFLNESGYDLTANESALLEAVALAWHQDSPMSVRQTISLEKLGSPATLHKRLATLRTQGFVEDMSMDGNRRTKLLIPTKKAIVYFEKLGSLIAIQTF